MYRENKELYEFAEFRLDVAERLLLHRGRRVSLTDRAFDTLCVLVRRGNQLTGKNELMEAVWGETIVEENNLDKNISLLRQILGEKKGKQKFIETVRGHGYRFLTDVRRVSAKETAAQTNADEASDKKFNRRKEDAPNYSPAPPVAVRRGDVPALAAGQIEIETQEISRAPIDSNAEPHFAARRAAGAQLIGREREITAIKNLLRSAEWRLITLTGAGGTGKTRLAEAVAQAVLPDFSDGVYFVELAHVSNPELIFSAIAQAVEIKESCGKAINQTLRNFLRERRALLVLDNFEQIVHAAPKLGELLASSPSLKILVTSRAVLHLSFEREFAVSPLAVPPPRSFWTIDELENYSSARLFVERARAVKPHFAPTEENALAIAGICRTLDGLPLAIEFAAARVKLLSPPEILKRLENRLSLLTSDLRDLPARQRTLRGAVEWGCDLLDENEKIAFRRLAVFAGGFTIEAAETVIGELSTDVFETVTSLIDNNLLYAKEQTSGETRLRMLEVVREFALEQLHRSGEGETLCRAHALYFLGLAEKAEPHLTGAKAAEWLEALETELDNLRHAIRWSIENEPPTALAMANLLWRLWALHGYLTEGRGYLESVLERNQFIEPKALGKALHRAGYLAQLQGDFAAAHEFYRKSLAVAEESGDRRLTAYLNRSLGIIAYAQGDFAAGRAFSETSLALGREIQDERLIAISLADLGEIERAEQNLQAARPLYEEALTLFRREGDKNSTGIMLCNLGALAFGGNDFSGARRFYNEALANFRELGNKIDLSNVLDGFAALFAHDGDWENSARLAGATDYLRQSTGCELEFADRPFREKYLAQIRGALGETRFAENLRQGQKMNLEDAVRLIESGTERFDASMVKTFSIE